MLGADCSLGGEGCGFGGWKPPKPLGPDAGWKTPLRAAVNRQPLAGMIPAMSQKAIQAEIADSVAVKQALARECAAEIAAVCDACVAAAKAGRTLFFCGNGGSFTDAQHIVGELVGRYAYDRPGIAAVALGGNFASLTAIANDYGYREIFVREVDALVRAGDVVIGLSTSGNSANVVAALERARGKGARTVAWTGNRRPAAVDGVADIVLRVPSASTQRIQESHILIGHIVAGAVEAAVHPRG